MARAVMVISSESHIRDDRRPCPNWLLVRSRESLGSCSDRRGAWRDFTSPLLAAKSQRR